MKAILERLSDNGRQTVGKLEGFNDAGELIFECDTLELAWKDNKQGVSCIPAGTYEVKTTFSNKYSRNMYQVMDVAGRGGIRIHSGNYRTDIEGCILVGCGYSDINHDGDADILLSVSTLNKMKGAMGKEFQLIINK
jgi:hypothetical protein